MLPTGDAAVPVGTSTMGSCVAAQPLLQGGFQLSRDARHIHPYLGSLTSAHLPKENPAHNGSKGGKRRSHYLTLSGPAFELTFMAGKLEQ